jgi:hypothetical protein
MVWYILQQCVFLYDTNVKYGLLESVSENSDVNLGNERVPSRQTIHNLVNTLGTTGLSTRNKNISAEC